MEGEASFSVFTWNILAPNYVRPTPAQDFASFPNCRDEDLEWEGRRAKIIQWLREAPWDVIALQEVEMEVDEHKKFVLPQWLREVLGKEEKKKKDAVEAKKKERVDDDNDHDDEEYAIGYHVQQHDPQQWQHQWERNVRVLGKGFATGVATLYRKSRFRHVASVTHSRALVSYLALVNVDEGEKKKKEDEKGKTLAEGGVEVVAVCNVHLEGHPDLWEARQQQLLSCIRQALRPRPCRLVVCGDFNPGSPEEVPRLLHQLTTHGANSPSSVFFLDQPSTVKKGLFSLPSQQPTWCDGRVALRLDHILYEPSCLEVMGVHEMFKHQHQPLMVALPSAQCPSDHTMLGGFFKLINGPVGGPKNTTTSPWENVTKERRDEIEQMWTQVLSKHQRCEAIKKKKGKPSPEEMELLKSFARDKKEWLSSYKREDEAAFAKHISK